MNPVLDYFKENIKEKKIFDEILSVRSHLLELEDEISNMKKQQIKHFKTRFELFKRGSARQSIHYDLMYACLFGNHVIV